MRLRCETCRYFKYVDSDAYGRCQQDAKHTASEGVPRIPWAMICQSYQGRTEADQARFRDLISTDPEYTSKLKDIREYDEVADDEP